MTKHLNITVNGRVQGVWFRATAKQKAIEIGIKGFVKNLVNRSVYIEAEGSSAQLELFLIWCKKGPPLAHVDGIISEVGAIKHFTTFEIE